MLRGGSSAGEPRAERLGWGGGGTARAASIASTSWRIIATWLGSGSGLGIGLGIVSTSWRTIAAYHVHSYRAKDGHR